MNLLEFHLLHSHAVFNGNRDDLGRPKSCTFGGVKRARISSQCHKRAIRLHLRDNSQWRQYFQAVRTKKVVDELAQRLKSGSDLTEDEKRLAQAASHVLAGLDFEKDGQRVTTSMFFTHKQYLGIADRLKALNQATRDETLKSLASYAELKSKREVGDAEKKRRAKLEKELRTSVGDRLDKLVKLHESLSELTGKGEPSADDRTKIEELNTQLDSLLPKPVDEAAQAMGLLLNLRAKPKLTKEEEQNVKQLNEQLRDLLKAPIVSSLDTTKDPLLVSDAADIALFGRMVASHPSLTVEAAAMFSHAISTHKAEAEPDFYTAVDDQAKDETGADMMGQLEFVSATYYRYIAINLDLLFHQKGDGLPPANLACFGSEKDRTTRQDIIRAFTEAVLRAVPSGRQTTMNSHTSVAYALGIVRKGQPLQLVNAFEKPVDEGRKETGLFGPSVSRLQEFHKKMFDAWEITDAKTACFCPAPPSDSIEPTPLPMSKFIDTLVEHVH